MSDKPPAKSGKRPLPIRSAATPISGASAADYAESLASQRGLPTVTGRAQPTTSLPTSLPTTTPVIDAEILPPGVEPDTVEGYQAQIESLHADAERTYVRIGALLKRAKEKLQAHGEWTRLTRSLPFSERTAHMLIRAAEAIQERLIPPDAAPRSWANVYLLSSMSADDRRRADEAGLIRPDVKRNEILAFKRRLAGERRDGEHDDDATGVVNGIGGDVVGSDVDEGGVDGVDPQAEIDRLLMERERIDRRIAELRQRAEGRR